MPVKHETINFVLSKVFYNLISGFFSKDKMQYYLIDILNLTKNAKLFSVRFSYTDWCTRSIIANLFRIGIKRSLKSFFYVWQDFNFSIVQVLIFKTNEKMNIFDILKNEYKTQCNLINTLLRSEGESNERKSVFKQLRELVFHHLDEEENQIFQVAGKTLMENEKSSLANDYREMMKREREQLK